MGEPAFRSMRAIRRLVLACLVAAAGVLPLVQSHAQDAQDGATAPSGRTSLPASIPVKREPSVEGASDGGNRWWMVIPVAAGLLAFAVIAARRNGLSAKPAGAWRMRFGSLPGTASSNEIQRLSSTRLTPRHSLHVVVWNGRQLLLGCTDQAVQLLAESPVTGETTEPGATQ